MVETEVTGALWCCGASAVGAFAPDNLDESEKKKAIGDLRFKMNVQNRVFNLAILNTPQYRGGWKEVLEELGFKLIQETENPKSGYRIYLYLLNKGG